MRDAMRNKTKLPWNLYYFKSNWYDLRNSQMPHYMKSVPDVVCCETLGLLFRLMASWWQVSFRTLFRAWTTLN